MESKVKEKVLDHAQEAIVGLLVLAIIPLFRLSVDDPTLNRLLIPIVQVGVALFVLAINYVRSNIKKRTGTKIVSPEGFALPWWRAVLLGTLVFVAILELAGFNLGIIIGFVMGEFDPDLFSTAMLPASFIITSILSFFLGRWVGMRVYQHGFLAMVLILLFGRIIDLLINMALLPLVLGENIPWSILFDPIFLGITALIIVFGAFGFWRGQKARPAAYLWYLVNALPEDTQKTLVDMVIGDVQNISASRNAAQTGAVPIH